MSDSFKNFNNDNFDSDVLKSEKNVLVDFWAEWCGPCKILTPVIDQIAIDNEGKYLIGKVNVDECPDIAAKYGIRSIPCLLYFKNGKVIKQTVGVVEKSEIESILESI
jgi:thioredoxin 1